MIPRCRSSSAPNRPGCRRAPVGGRRWTDGPRRPVARSARRRRGVGSPARRPRRAQAGGEPAARAVHVAHGDRHRDRWEGFCSACSPIAQPEIRKAANACATRSRSAPPAVGRGDWHCRSSPTPTGQKCPTSRCCRRSRRPAAAGSRTSITPAGATSTTTSASTHVLSIAAAHASPLEHVATPADPGRPSAGISAAGSSYDTL